MEQNSADTITKLSHVVITGASSGIGRALALHYAGPGVVLSLSGRDAGRLEEVANACRAKGADVHGMVLSVTQGPAMEQWLIARDDEAPVDLVIANAGIAAGAGSQKTGESPGQVRDLFAVNVTGVLNTIDPLTPRMIARGRGQVAIISSLAGFFGGPGAPAYCATKAAVRIYGEGLRATLRGTGVRVNVVCPGFVVTRMTAINEFAMPLIMSAERAAGIIARGLARDRPRIAFPLPLYALSLLLSVLPPGLVGRLFDTQPGKAKQPANIQSGNK